MTRRTLRNSHQTTIRFTEQLWIELEAAAAHSGVSVAQYVRDAARARLEDERHAPSAQSPDGGLRGIERANAMEHSLEQVENSSAVWEQGRLAREPARLLRDEAQRRRQPAR